MEQEDVSVHYSDIAGHYDDMYGFTNDYTAEFVVKHLQLKPDDRLVDIGAGTGQISSLIWKKAGLNNPVLCVEPSADMLRVAEAREGVQPYLATADSFFQLQANHNTQSKYNKILINECAHLFPNTLETFRKAHSYLPDDGLLLLIQRSTVCTFPMWKALKENFAPVSVDTFRSYLEKAGFNVTVTVECGVTMMSKCDWYDKLRRRIFTVLHEFTDDQIEEGLQELDKGWFAGKEESDAVEITDNLAYFTATKEH